MKFQLLPSTFDENGCASKRQHLACFIIDDCVAIDAGSLAMAATSIQRKQIRDIILTHAHLDHVAGLPLFVDDLFATLEEPIRIYATENVIKVLERDIFNWDVYPSFSDLENDHGDVLQYRKIKSGKEFRVKHLEVKPLKVNHNVPAVGFIISDGKTKIAISGDTAEPEDFWEGVNLEKDLDYLLIECAFPDELEKLAESSHHLVPKLLKKEIRKFRHNCPIYAINIKPMYCEKVVSQIKNLNIENLHILEVGKVYDW
ncbi:MAG: 3',5'-cyclic-nucleotide phosphodiesterase [Pyrinomonadaceae bacterium]